MKNLNRRKFITGMLATSVFLQIPRTALALPEQKAKPVKVGLITDLHQDVIHNGYDRLQAFLKLLVAINGHTHVDCQLCVKNINYVHINSASFFYVGGDYKHNSYGEEIHQSHPWIVYTCPYREPLFTTLAIEPAAGLVKIEGRKTEWVGPSPAALKFSDKFFLSPGKEIVPHISSRKL